MSTPDLIKLSKNPKDLREDVLPILKAELLKRGKKDDALALFDFHENGSELNYQDLSLKEIRQMVQDRVNSGESMESIKIDLKENGIDVFEILKEDHQFQEKVFHSITQMKQDGATSIEIDEHLEKAYNLEKADAVKLKSDLKIKGKRNKNIGFALILVSFIIGSYIIIKDDRYKGLLKCVALMVTGFSLYIIGTKQEKD